jgi:hypothetical protein
LLILLLQDAAAHVMNMMVGSLSELESDLKRKADDDDGGTNTSHFIA